jgi:hypothetical protein
MGRVRQLNGAPWVGLKYLRGPDLSLRPVRHGPR